MKIAVDTMGGDNAPGAIVEGAILAGRETGCEILLVGQREIVEAELAKYKTDGLSIGIVHASEVVGNEESPSLAYKKKKDSSIMVGIKLLEKGEADAFMSAGNTGAVMTHGALILRLIPGVSRAAIAVVLPTQRGWSVLLDAGANVDSKSQTLFEFGIMGSVYASHVLDKPFPTAGLLNIGEEEGKGNEIAKMTGTMLKRSSINFIGNVEAKEVYRGTVDVIICDGFIGNIALKVSESVEEMFTKAMKEIFSKNLKGRFAYFLIRPYLEEFKRRVDYHEYGAAPLLGLNGTVFICHGSSTAKSIKNGIKHVEQFIRMEVNKKIHKGIEKDLQIEKMMEKKNGFWAQIKHSIQPESQKSEAKE